MAVTVFRNYIVQGKCGFYSDIRNTLTAVTAVIPYTPRLRGQPETVLMLPRHPKDPDCGYAPNTAAAGSTLDTATSILRASYDG